MHPEPATAEGIAFDPPTDPGSEVLVLQHVPYEGPGRIANALRRAGLRWHLVETYKGEAVLRSLSSAAGLVVLGGPEAGEDTRWPSSLSEEMILIGKAIDRRVPVLGISLGAELLAATLGARVYPAVYLELGWNEYALQDEARQDFLFEGEPPRFHAFHWHGDVFSLPRGAVPLVTGGVDGDQGFRWGECSYGFRFHPEITAPQIMTLVNAFLLEEPLLEGHAEAIAAGIGQYGASTRALFDRVLQRWVARVSCRAFGGARSLLPLP